MRVLQIVHSQDPGGVLTIAESLAAGLGGNGIEIETAFLYPETAPSRLHRLRHASRLASRLLAGRYDAVIAYQATASLLAGIVGAIGGIKTRIVHQTSAPDVSAWPLRMLDKLAGTIGIYTVNVANSRATLAEFDRYPTRYRRSLRLIEHGVSPPRSRRRRQETWTRYGVPDDGPILLNVGRLAIQKNQQVLIRALADLPGMRLVLVGVGPLEADLRALAARLGVADRLHLLGSVAHTETADLYAATDLFVFPSATETFGIAVVEAVILGVPTLAADLPVLREVLDAGQASAAGFIAADDVKGWTERIAATVAQPPSPAHLTAFGAAIAAKYSERRMVERYVELLIGPGARE